MFRVEKQRRKTTLMLYRCRKSIISHLVHYAKIVAINVHASDPGSVPTEKYFTNHQWSR